MDFVLSLIISSILLLNSAGRFECSGVDDGTVPTPLLSSSTMEGTETTTPPGTKETIEKREVSSGFSSPDIEATKLRVPPAVDASTLKSNRTVDAEEEGTSREPLIIDLGNLPSIRVRRSDSNEFTASTTADQVGEPAAEEDEYEGSIPKINEDPTIQESAEDPSAANIREERKLESDEILEGVEQDQGRMFGGWYRRRRRSFAERRLQN
ncbi:uncharacterized protein LOC143212309 [Lasioglossum baleicum]|uniref:uncharacterized protein LOC143212309 n=1 Tax=Lasioglossum baleicum TaxID=434251 RepID=UPI003FCDCEEE